MEHIMSRVSIPHYSVGEECVNSISHGIGAVASMVGLAMLLAKARDPFSLACAGTFGVTMVLLYAVSCVYHALPASMPGKRVMRVIDHCNVYALVFGTYVPASLLGVGGALGWALFCAVGVFTVIGIVCAVVDVDRYGKVQVVCHLLSGWSFLLGLPALMASCGLDCVLLIVCGGVAYSLGAALYGLGKKQPYMHSVFHVLCMVGTFFHFWAIYTYII